MRATLSWAVTIIRCQWPIMDI